MTREIPTGITQGKGSKASVNPVQIAATPAICHHHEHGKQIKESERDIVLEVPIDQRNHRDQDYGPQ
jgi:hypothetical protein